MKNLFTIVAFFFILGCSPAPKNKVVLERDSSFIPLSVVSGQDLDPVIILPLLGWTEKEDSSSRLAMEYVNIDGDPENEMILKLDPGNNDLFAIFFLDKKKDSWNSGGHIAQGGLMYSQSSLPEFDRKNKIFWLDLFMNGDCLGGDFKEGYQFIDGKIEHVISIPQNHDGCCQVEADRTNYCVHLSLEEIQILDSTLQVEVYFAKTKEPYWNSGQPISIFQRPYSFQLYFDRAKKRYVPNDSSEWKYIVDESYVGATYPPIDAYQMETYLEKKYGLVIK